MEVKPTVRAEHPPVSQTSCTPGNANDALCLVLFVFLDELTFGALNGHWSYCNFWHSGVYCLLIILQFLQMLQHLYIFFKNDKENVTNWLENRLSNSVFVSFSTATANLRLSRVLVIIFTQAFILKSQGKTLTHRPLLHSNLYKQYDGQTFRLGSNCGHEYFTRKRANVSAEFYT